MMLMSRRLDSAVARFGCLKTPKDVQKLRRGQQALLAVSGTVAIPL